VVSYKYKEGYHMAKRKIIKIDEEKCNGCGLCIPNCPEGALQMIDNKARLISDLFCDGLGACIGYCPEGAITIEEREAEPYNEKKVMENIVKQGKNVIAAHLDHLKGHGDHEHFKEAVEFLKEKNIDIPTSAGVHAHAHSHEGGCPGSKVMEFKKTEDGKRKTENRRRKTEDRRDSQLGQWPIQIMLVPPIAPYLNNADLLIAADCVPFAYADFHEGLLKDKVLLIGCPKLDDAEYYKEKLTNIFKTNNIKSITCAHMEVPCCFGMVSITKEAISASGKNIPFEDVTITIKGERR